MKKVLKAIWDEFIYGGHLLALGLVSLVAVAAILLNIHITWDFAIVIYSLSLAPCLFGRYFDLKKDALTNPDRSQYFEKKAKFIPYVIALLFLAMLGILIYFNKFFALLFGTGLILLSVLYDIFLKGLTRRIIGFKNLFISLIFTLLVALLLVYYKETMGLSAFFVMVFVYLMILIGTSFSDIKDIESDKKEGLKTFVVVLGEKRFFLFLSIISTIVACLVISSFFFKILPNFVLMLLLTVLYNFLLFMFARKKIAKADFLVNVACDCQLILWLIFVLIGKLIFK